RQLDGEWTMAVKDAWRYEDRESEGDILSVVPDSTTSPHFCGYLEHLDVVNHSSAGMSVARFGLEVKAPTSISVLPVKAKAATDYNTLLFSSSQKALTYELHSRRARNLASESSDLQCQIATSSTATSRKRPSSSSISSASKRLKSSSSSVLAASLDDTVQDPITPPPYCGRIHTRLVMTKIGQPLSSYETPLQLLRAIRSALIGHGKVYGAGYLHRDISCANILLPLTPTACDEGFLIDLDY